MDPHSQEPQRTSRSGLDGVSILSVEVREARRLGNPKILALEVQEILAKIPGAEELLKEFRDALPLHAVSSGDASLTAVSLGLQVLRLAILHQQFDRESLRREIEYLRGQLNKKFENTGEPPEEPEEDNNGWSPGNDDPWG